MDIRLTQERSKPLSSKLCAEMIDDLGSEGRNNIAKLKALDEQKQPHESAELLSRTDEIITELQAWKREAELAQAYELEIKNRYSAIQPIETNAQEEVFLYGLR